MYKSLTWLELSPLLCHMYKINPSLISACFLLCSAQVFIVWAGAGPKKGIIDHLPQSVLLSSANYFNVFCHVTLKNHISGVIYSSISSYTSLEREKNTLSKKKYFGRRKPIIFCHKKIKKHILHKNFLKFLKTVI